MIYDIYDLYSDVLLHLAIGNINNCYWDRRGMGNRPKMMNTEKKIKQYARKIYTGVNVCVCMHVRLHGYT